MMTTTGLKLGILKNMLTMTAVTGLTAVRMCASSSSSPSFSPSSSSPASAAALPLRSIPGNYGLPLVGALKDRLDYFWFQGPETFFRQRAAEYKSTVFRTNMPPTFVGVDPRVIALLDCASFPALFDLSLVEKKDVLVGDYMPSVAFTGNTRVAVYMDPSESQHSPVKSFCLDILRRSSQVWVSEFLSNANTMLDKVEGDLSVSSSSSFMVPLQKCIFAFLTKSLVGADPSKTLGDQGWVILDTWLALQLLPITKAGVLPQPLDELLLHSFPFPFWPVSGGYRKLYQFVEKEGTEVMERGEREFGLSKEEAINNILFVLGFNAFGGFTVFLPSLITRLGSDKTGLQQRLRDDVRKALAAASNRSICFETVKEMELVRSTVYEVLRLNPPVALQYGRARKDFVLNSHEMSYEVKKGELLCGYQPLAMRDPRVFQDPESFVPDRFVDNKELLQYLYWSNGPETETPTASNKQCAAKDYVVGTACMLVALIFTRYDGFQCDDSALTITELVKATEPAPTN